MDAASFAAMRSAAAEARGMTGDAAGAGDVAGMKLFIALVLGLVGGAYALWFAQVLSEEYHTLFVPILMHAVSIAGILGAGLVLVRPKLGAVLMAGAALGILLTLSVSLGLIPALLLAVAALLAYRDHPGGTPAVPSPGA